MRVEHGQEKVSLSKHGGEIPLPDADTVQRDVHFVILAMAGECPKFAGLILKLQLYQQIAGILMVEVVDLRAGIESHAGNSKGDGVGNAAFPHAHMAGDHIHAAKLKSLLVRISLKPADCKPGHAKLLDRLDHLIASLLMRPVLSPGRGSDMPPKYRR